MNVSHFESYLKKRHKAQTAASYLWSTGHFVSWAGEENLALVRYKDIMAYVGHLRERKQKANHISAQLAAIKVLFDYLVSQGERVDNPAEAVILKDAQEKPVQFDELFTAEELRSLLHVRERYSLLRFRNQAMTGLLIYQAPTSRELVALRVSDIYLESGEVFIAAKTNTLSRVLKLEPSQVEALRNYITYERPLLAKVPTDRLFLSKLGEPIDKEGLHYLLERSKKRFPGKTLNCVTVRQSVIVNRFKEGWNVRQIQLFSGIKYASTVERYRPPDRQALRASLLRFHPMA